MALKSKREHDIEDIFKGSEVITSTSRSQITTTISQTITPSEKLFNDFDWDVIDEYDPLWPNEYEKLVREKREKEDKPRDRFGNRDDRKRRGSRFNDDQSPPPSAMGKYSSGFGGRPSTIDDEDNYNRSPPSGSGQSSSNSLSNRSSGAAIAPPASLQENVTTMQTFTSINDAKVPSNVAVPYTSSVAAKIMAKYGFKVNFIFICICSIIFYKL